ncbi:MAG: MBL fold metallo-hydrolase [Proteobacteria bacterium]|nr:MBL fold metallo-hydrolase [Pseudomonadota bacterium]
MVLIDAQRKSREAQKLAELIRSKHQRLTHILITHGHTDHFTGIALLHSQFPQARIVVATEAIKRDIKEYAIYMDRGGATGAEPALEPALKPRSSENPEGFDYEGIIQVLGSDTLELDGGGLLELDSGHPPTEAMHMTTVYIRSLNALFLSDLGYNHVHLWLGDDIDTARMLAWKAELLRLKAVYAPQDPRIYPGHGDPTDASVFDADVRYLDDFMRIAAGAHAAAELITEMRTLYPDYREADFFLKYSAEAQVRPGDSRT